MSDAKKSISYTDYFESFLKEEGEKAEAMAILHYRSHEFFDILSIVINVPVIVLSSVVGFLSPIPLFSHQAVILGSLSVLISLLKVCDNYFNITQLSERHRSVSLQYMRITKWIQIQLCLERDVRISAQDLFDMITTDMSNIRDAEPIIPQLIIDRFVSQYKNEPTAKPSITNGLTSIKIYKSSSESLANVVIEPKAAIVPEKKPIFKP